jgi:hypothetical protein
VKKEGNVVWFLNEEDRAGVQIKEESGTEQGTNETNDSGEIKDAESTNKFSERKPSTKINSPPTKKGYSSFFWDF